MCILYIYIYIYIYIYMILIKLPSYTLNIGALMLLWLCIILAFPLQKLTNV